jgi:HEAT repeat protein
MDRVRAYLDPEEPNYGEAARNLGADALPHLEALVSVDDPLLASKAAYLAGLLGAERSSVVLETAARSSHPVVRVAAAFAARHLPAAEAGTVLSTGIADDDLGVRKAALRSAAEVRAPGLKVRVQELSKTDPSEAIRALASEAADVLP